MIRGLATNDSFRNVLKQESVQSLPTYAQNIPPALHQWFMISTLIWVVKGNASRGMFLSDLWILSWYVGAFIENAWNLGGGFKYVLFHPIWGRFPFWLMFSDGLKPPTRIHFNRWKCHCFTSFHFPKCIHRGMLAWRLVVGHCAWLCWNGCGKRRPGSLPHSLGEKIEKMPTCWVFPWFSWVSPVATVLNKWIHDDLFCLWNLAD